MRISELESIVFKVLSTIKKYEGGFVSVSRNPIDPRERVNSVKDFVECRLNYELFKIDELRDIEEIMDGHLLVATEITDELGRHYDTITLEVGDRYGIMSDQQHKYVVEKFINIIGGNKIIFGSDKRDPSVRIFLDNDEIINTKNYSEDIDLGINDKYLL